MKKLSVISNIIQEPILKEIHIECSFPKDMELAYQHEFVDLVKGAFKDVGAAIFDKKTTLAIDTGTKVYTFKFAGLLVCGKENHYNYHYRFIIYE
ncbi:MAG TPA: hypothetical protein PLG47_04250 [Candidatus Dojkabacteria bacterium]|nr:hypothetical protein [Candidatus Dojkabacteria bacterium]